MRLSNSIYSNPPIMLVSNEFPTITLPQKLAIIGEAPGLDELKSGRPFTGPSGQLLNAALGKYKLPRSACFVGNVCQTRPDGNDFELFDWEGPEIQSGLKQLRADLDIYEPNLCLLLGANALKASTIPHSISTWRGSLFHCDDPTSPFFGRKCLASYHPAAILRFYERHPLFVLDMQRAVKQSEFPELRIPKRNFEVDLSCGEAINRLRAIKPGDWISVDIEGGIVDHKSGKPTNVSVIGFATSPTHAFTVNLISYNIDEQLELYPHLHAVLANPDIKKILQNCLYDNFVMTWLWRIPINGIIHDTMISGWELFPELEKGLDIQTSIYTDQPYYKHWGKIADNRSHFIYCAMDSMVTYEIAQKHRKLLKPEAFDHFNLNMRLLAPTMYMELKGFNLNKEACAEKLAEVLFKMNELETRVNVSSVYPVKLSSPKQLSTLLYSRLNLPPQYIYENGRKTDRLTTNEDALLTLLVKTAGGHDHPTVLNVLKWKQLDGLRKQLCIEPDADGRVRCTFNLVGAETGRFTSSKSPTGTGANLQTITEDLRFLYCADPGYTMFQCDFKGADGWTVATHSQVLGDSTMLDDYLADIKPARVIACMYLLGSHVAKLSQPELKALIDKTDIPPWLYFACKRVQHASSYAMKEQRMSDLILADSWSDTGKPIYLAPKDCKALQKLFFLRYWGVEKWQREGKATLERDGKMTCCSGNTRQFFGRKFEPDTHRAWLSHEPQHITTYSTSLAMLRLWLDEENRDPDGAPIIQPLNQVHDALVGQFPTYLSAWAIPKIKTYFQNEVSVAGQKLTIPADAKFGPNWGELHAL